MEPVNPTEPELRAFIGPRADQFWRRWRPCLEGSSGSAGGFWLPVFLGHIWFFYRRMYREVWVPLALIVGVGAIQGSIEAIVEMRSGAPYTTPKPLNTGINVGLAFGISYLGSYMYLRRFRKSVNVVRQTLEDEAERLAALRAAGGTSWVGASIGIAITFLLFVIGSAMLQGSG